MTDMPVVLIFMFLRLNYCFGYMYRALMSCVSSRFI